MFRVVTHRFVRLSSVVSSRLLQPHSGLKLLASIDPSFSPSRVEVVAWLGGFISRARVQERRRGRGQGRSRYRASIIFSIVAHHLGLSVQISGRLLLTRVCHHLLAFCEIPIQILLTDPSLISRSLFQYIVN